MNLKIDDNNYQTYKQVYEILCKHLHKDFEGIIPADANPIAILNSWEIKSKSIAKRGLKTGLMDLLGIIKDIPNDIRTVISSDLEKNNLPSISKLTGVIKDSINNVLQTRKINNIDQYYIIKELLDDTVSDITDTQRRDLSIFLGEYEAKVTNR